MYKYMLSCINTLIIAMGVLIGVGILILVIVVGLLLGAIKTCGN
jgi:hypothetical protein